MSVTSNPKKFLDPFHNVEVESHLRGIHYIVDTTLVILISMLFNFVAQFFIATADRSINNPIDFMLLLIAFFAYYLFMETNFQKTIGKYITNTKVVIKDGSKPNSGDIFIRTLCRLIPFDNLSFLYTPNGFHDNLSNTKLVKDVK